MQYFPIYNQNISPNLIPVSEKLSSINSNKFQNLNYDYQNTKIRRQLSPQKLTDNISYQKTATSSNNSYQISQQNTQICQNPVFPVQSKLISITSHFAQKSPQIKQRHHSSNNFHTMNLQNYGVVEQKKEIIPIYQNQNNLIVNNYVPRTQKRNLIPRIPHPKMKKNLVQVVSNKYYTTNDNYTYLNYNNNNINTITNIKILNKNNMTSSLGVEVEEDPKSNFNLSEFIMIKKLGQGTEGEIFSVQWKKNNKKYALKKSEIRTYENFKKRKDEFVQIKKFIETSGCDSLIKLYGNLSFTNNVGNYMLYEIMELAERDWEQEILDKQRRQSIYYEYELLNITKGLIKTFSLLQSEHISHRDIKPQNIMIVNGKFKICDFGNARILKNNGIIIQRIRGSELFMSPILFKAYHSGITQVKHNTYKSDVFSLGMCLFFAACLGYEGPNFLRDKFDMNIVKKILYQYLGKRYSQKFINFLLIMLQLDETKRPDFISLESLFQTYFINY